LNSNRDLLAASGTSEDNAIQVFELESGIWQPHLTITVELSSSFSFASPDGIPVLAIASPTSFRVLQYISGVWTRRGQEKLEWVAPDSTVELSVSLSAISISLDGRSLLLDLASGISQNRKSIQNPSQHTHHPYAKKK
jgi:hypothetical protein